MTLLETILPQLGPVATQRDKWPAVLRDAGRWLASPGSLFRVSLREPEREESHRMESRAAITSLFSSLE